MLALVGLGAWALPTFLIGLVDMAHALWLGETLHRVEPGRSFAFSPMESVMIAIGVLWFLSLAAVLLALVVGTVDIATRLRSWRRCVAFAGVAIAGPMAAYALNAASWYDRFARTRRELVLWDAVHAAGMVAIPVVTLAAAWLLLGLRRARRP